LDKYEKTQHGKNYAKKVVTRHKRNITFHFDVFPAFLAGSSSYVPYLYFTHFSSGSLMIAAWQKKFIF